MEENKKTKRRILDRPVFSVLLALVLMTVGQIAGAFLEYIPFLNKGKIAITALFYLEFIGIWAVTLAYLALTRKNRPILQTLWRKPSGNTVRNLLIGLLIGFGMNSLCILAAWLHGDIRLSYVSFQPLGLPYVFAAVFIQSSAEELICRGVLYQRLLKFYRKPVFAIVGNSLLFAALHLMNEGVTILSLVNIFTVGILFSLMVYYMDSIWCAMAMHTAWNFNQNILFGLPNSGIRVPFSVLKLEAGSARDSFAYNVGFGVEGTVFADLVLVAACVAMYLWGRRHAAKPLNIWEEENP